MVAQDQKGPSDDAINQADVIARWVKKQLSMLEFIATTAGQRRTRLLFPVPSVTDGEPYTCTAGAVWLASGRMKISISAYCTGAWLANDTNVTAFDLAMAKHFPGSRRLRGGRDHPVQRAYSVPLG